MINNYFKVIFRHVHKNRLYTFINLIGLALGLSALILTSIYLHFELSYEKFHSKSERIFRATYAYDSGNGFEVHWARVPVNYINELPAEFPEIKHLIRFQNHERKYVKIDDNKFRPEHAYITDNEVFEVFDFEIISGNPKTALKEPYSIAITESLAKQYFGTTDVLGKNLGILGDWNSEEQPHTITAIIKDVPKQTHLPIDMLISFQNEQARSGWAYCYFLLNEEAQIANLIDKMKDFVAKHADTNSAEK